MTRDELARHAENLFHECLNTIGCKGREYQNNPNEADDAQTDAFGNFKRVGRQLGVIPEMAAMTYKLKHTDSICRYIKDIELGCQDGYRPVEFADNSVTEPIEGRLIDDIVYSVILHAMITERRKVEDAGSVTIRAKCLCPASCLIHGFKKRAPSENASQGEQQPILTRGE